MKTRHTPWIALAWVAALAGSAGTALAQTGPGAMGGPNGGDGGRGGDIWLVADRNVASLLAFRDHPHRIGGNGVHGMGKDQHGRRGETLEVKVPEGYGARIVEMEAPNGRRMYDVRVEKLPEA